MRQTQSGFSDTRSHPRALGDRTQGKIFHITLDDVRATPDVVTGTLHLDSQQVFALLDLGATHSFVAKRFKSKSSVKPVRVNPEFVISTPLGEAISVEHMYTGVNVMVEGLVIEVDLLPLNMT